MDYRLPIPKNWQDFESLCLRLWQEIWNDPNAQKNGRSGQPQNGVDVFGTPIFSKSWAGVQCKNKDGNLGSILEVDEISYECSKAVKFAPQISSFIIATTSPRDSKLQEKARELTHGEDFPISVSIWGWDDIESELIFRPNVLSHFYPNFSNSLFSTPYITINRFSSFDQLSSFFSRPCFQSILPERFKEQVISLGYELSDNAYLHGGASFFRIEVENGKISFRDNGRAFNPIVNMANKMASSSSGIGLFYLRKFIQRFSGFVSPVYSLVKNNGKNENLFEFVFSRPLSELPIPDYFELNISQLRAGGRFSGIKIANSIPIRPETREFIWAIAESYSLSFIAGFIEAFLKRIDEYQKLILSIPRDEFFGDIKNWFNDDKLIIRSR